MTESMVITLGREALLTIALIAGPPLLIGMAVGLIISILQATTQIQEQTLTFVPKIIAVLISIVAFGPWMLRILTDFTYRLIANLPGFIS